MINITYHEARCELLAALPYVNKPILIAAPYGYNTGNDSPEELGIGLPESNAEKICRFCNYFNTHSEALSESVKLAIKLRYQENNGVGLPISRIGRAMGIDPEHAQQMADAGIDYVVGEIFRLLNKEG